MKGYGVIENRIYIGRYSDQVSRGDVALFLRGFGPIKDIRMMTRFSFAEFGTREQAEAAVRELNGQFLKGTRVRVDHAASPKDDKENGKKNKENETSIQKNNAKTILKGKPIDYSRLSSSCPFGRHGPLTPEQDRDLFQYLNKMAEEDILKYSSGRRLMFLW